VNDSEVTSTALTELLTLPAIIKLVSVQSGTPDEVLVLSALDYDNCPGVGVLNLSNGTVTPLQQSNSREDKDLVTKCEGRNVSTTTAQTGSAKSEENAEWCFS